MTATYVIESLFRFRKRKCFVGNRLGLAFSGELPRFPRRGSCHRGASPQAFKAREWVVGAVFCDFAQEVVGGDVGRYRMPRVAWRGARCRPSSRGTSRVWTTSLRGRMVYADWTRQPFDVLWLRRREHSHTHRGRLCVAELQGGVDCPDVRARASLKLTRVGVCRQLLSIDDCPRSRRCQRLRFKVCAAATQRSEREQR